ncbi:MAG: tryptophan synthase subunit alpha [Myxococcota bacterium]
MNHRYDEMFARARSRGERGVFIPFVMLGDPTLDRSFAIIETLIAAGADGLEVGLPFSDPIADGPVVQQAAQRAQDAGARTHDALELVRRVREAHPDVPMGLLVYANLVVHRGMDAFYSACAGSGLDSVLVADVPTREAAPFVSCALKHHISPVLIATPDASDEVLRMVAEYSRGYTYVVTRRGVTGERETLEEMRGDVLSRLKELGGAPGVLGFGISAPEHVGAAMDMGAAGAISGSAVIRRIAQNLGDDDAMHQTLGDFVHEMKAATRG